MKKGTHRSFISFCLAISLLGSGLILANANPITYEPPKITVSSPIESSEYQESGVPVFVTVTLYGYTYQDVERIRWLNFSLDEQTQKAIPLSYPSSYGPNYNVTGISYIENLSEGSHTLNIIGETTFNQTLNQLIRFSVDLDPNGNQEADSWKTLASMPTERMGLGCAELNGKIYSIGGRSKTTGYDVNEMYDPKTNIWVTLSSMLHANGDFGTAVYDNKIFCIGGHSGFNQVYDPEADEWETRTQMPTSRTLLTANLVNGKIYFIGGLLPNLNPDEVPAGPNISNATEVYDPDADTWTTLTPIPTPVFNYASAVKNDKIYVISGYHIQGYTDQVQVYEPKTDTWTTASPVPLKVSGASAISTTGTKAPKQIFVIGGRNPSTNNSFPTQIYDPSKDEWTLGAPPSTSRTNLGLATVDDVIYAIGGASLDNQNPEVYALNEQYIPVSYQNDDPNSPDLSDSIEPTPSIPEFSFLTTAAIMGMTVITLLINKKGQRLQKKLEPVTIMK